MHLSSAAFEPYSSHHCLISNMTIGQEIPGHGTSTGSSWWSPLRRRRDHAYGMIVSLRKADTPSPLMLEECQDMNTSGDRNSRAQRRHYSLRRSRDRTSHGNEARAVTPSQVSESIRPGLPMTDIKCSVVVRREAQSGNTMLF